MFNCTLICINNKKQVYPFLVHSVVVLVSRSDGLPDPSGYQSVPESHPDAFPDVLLDLVVILKRVVTNILY